MMNHLKTLAASATIAVLSGGPALAQTAPAPVPPPPPPPYYFYHHPMMWHGGPFHLIGVVLVVLLIIALFRAFGRRRWYGYGYGHGPRGDMGRSHRALDILEERYARGEINKEEFEEKRRLLER